MEDPHKSSKKEDLEIVRRAILQSQTSPLSEQILNAEVKKKVEVEGNDTFFKQFEHGYKLLIEEIKNKAVDGLYTSDNVTLPLEQFQIDKEKMSAIKKMIAEGTMNDMPNFSSDAQFLFYEKAISFYDQALYEKSIDAFAFLTAINPNVQAFWIALGLSYEKNLNYPDAIDCLEAAIQCEPNDFNPYYGILRCSEALKDYARLEELLNVAKNNEALKEEAQDLLDYLHPDPTE